MDALREKIEKELLVQVAIKQEITSDMIYDFVKPLIDQTKINTYKECALLIARTTFNLTCTIGQAVSICLNKIEAKVKELNKKEVYCEYCEKTNCGCNLIKDWED